MRPLSDEPVRVFATKVDSWLVLVLSTAILFGGGAAAYAVSGSPAVGVIALALVTSVFLLVALISIPTRYELHADALVIRSGILRYRVAYPSIRAVEPTRSPMSGPAWSLSRLRIDHDGGSVLVSPKDREGFLSELGMHTRQLRRKGDRLSLVPEGP